MSRSYYVPALKRLPEYSIEWFVDSNLNRARGLAKEYGHGEASENYKETIDTVDGAIVATPNYIHAEVSVDFLLRGRNVLCEKPIATNSREAQKIIAASEENGARLAVNMIRRKYDSYRAAKFLLKSGILGPIIQVTCEEGKIFDWHLSSSYMLDRKKAGGGILIDIGTHLLDGLQWIFDSNLELVSYEDDSHGGVEANCNADLAIQTRNERIPCRMTLSRTRILSNKIILRGEKMSLEVRDENRGGVFLEDDRGYDLEPTESKSYDDVDFFKGQVSSFFGNASNDCATGPDALRTLQLVETCYGNRREINYPWEEKTTQSVGQPPLLQQHKVLVVGASGFLGSRLAERLSLDYGTQVRATFHRPENAVRVARLPVELVECDLLKPSQVSEAVKGCDVVVNCGNEASSDKQRILRFYTEGISNLLQASEKFGVRKFIHLSSAAIHPFSGKHEIIDENSRRLTWPFPYARGKIKSEQLVNQYAGKFAVTILRPTLIYGPYSPIWTTGIIQRVTDNLVTVIGRDSLANIVYVDDVVNAIIVAMENDRTNGEAFIINGDDKKVSWKEYVNSYSEELGYSSVPERSEYSLELQRAKNFVLMLSDSICAIKNLIRSPEFLALLARIPLVVQIGLRLLKDRKREEVESSITSVRKLPKPNRKILLKYEVLEKQLYSVFTCKAVFSSAKARNLMGFTTTSFKDGIKNTLDWAKWANYLKPNSSQRTEL